MDFETYNARSDLRNPQDIHFVTVHGICDDPDSGQASDSGNTERPWLEQFVAKQYDGSQITNFRYTLDIESGVPISEIDRIAVDLLRETNEQLTEGHHLVLISQDIGGLIVKQALLNAMHKEMFSSFAEKTIVLMFIGTPQRATASESWEEIALKLILKGRNVAMCTISRVQEQLAHALMEVSENFQSLSRIYSFVSLYENIADPSLALTSFSKETSEMNIAKEFVSSIDRDLKGDLNDGIMKAMNHIIGNATVINKSYIESFRTLSLVDGEYTLTSSNKSTILQHEDALKWVLEKKAFERWSNSTCWLLWLHGQFSSDISASLSAVEKAGFKNFKNPAVIKFSFSSQYDRYSSTYEMLASLSHQLLILRPELFDHVRQLYEKISQDLPWRVDQLWVLFRSLLLCTEHGVTICIIDMIDECDKTRNQFLTDLFQLPGSEHFRGSLKLIATSHEGPSDEYKYDAVVINIDEELEQTEETKRKKEVVEDGRQARSQESENSQRQNSHETEKEMTPEKRPREHNDLAEAFDAEISHLFRARPELLKFKNIVQSKLRATTNELSASLTLTLLQAPEARRTYLLLKSDLQSIPATLFELYRHFTDRIPEEHLLWTWKVISWIMNAYRPLKLAELTVALCLEKDISSTSALLTILPQNLALDIQQVLGNLITFQNDEVSFVHVSFQEFLLKEYWNSPQIYRISEDLTVTPLRRTFRFDDHAEMAEACLRYISLVTKQWKEERSRYSRKLPEDMLFVKEEQYAFLAYAIKYWHKHYNAAKHEIYPNLHGMALQFLQDPDCLQFWQGLDWFLNSALKKARSFVISPILVAVRLRCCDLVKELLGKHQNTNDLSMALKSAIENQDDRIIDVLKDAGATHSEELHLAALYGRDQLLARLLERFDPSTSISTRLLTEPSPLHLASAAGHHLFVSRLINAGFELDDKTNDEAGMTSLHIASQFGHLLVIQELLNHGADVTMRDNNDWTALHVACKWQQASAVIKLLKSNTPIHSISKDGRTALHLAAESGRTDIVNYLLGFLKNLKELGSLQTALQCEDESQSTPLHLAASNGHVEVVRQLLDCSTDSLPATSMRDNARNTPLHLAAKNGHHKVVQAFLLETKAPETDNDENVSHSIISTENKEFQLPIHLAVFSGDVATVYQLADAHENKGIPLDVSDRMGYSPLHLACLYGFAIIVEILISFGAQVDITDIYSQTPLHIACAKGHLEIVENLLRDGADQICTDSAGNSALHHATTSGAIEVVKALFRIGWKPTKQSDYVNTRNNAGNTPLHIAAEINNVQITEVLLGEGADVTELNSSGRSALYLAAKSRNTEIMVRLLKEIKKDSSISTSAGEMLDVVRILLEAIPGVAASDDGRVWPNDETPDERASNASTEDEVKPPHWYSDQILDALPKGLDVKYVAKYEMILRLAARNGEHKVVERIVELGKADTTGAINLNAVDEYNQTALLLAAMRGQAKIVKLLLTIPDVINKCDSEDKDMRSALSYAAEFGNLKVVEHLVFCKGRPFMESRTYREALSYAAKEGHDEIVDLLLNDVKPHPPTATEEPLFDQALFQAISGMHVEIVKLLLERGANTGATDEHGFTALHLATRAGNLEVVKYLLETEKVSNLNVLSGGSRQTALYMAAWLRKTDIVKILLDYDADTEKPDVKGWRPLHAAYDSVEIVQLLAKKANIDAMTDQLETPMYIAMFRGYAPVARELIKYGAKTFARTKFDRTPLHEAVGIRRPEILKEMVESAAKTEAGRKALGDIAMECDDIGLIDLVLEHHVNSNGTDLHGWSLAWTKYVTLAPVDERSKPSNASEMKFQDPTQWNESDKSTLLIVSGDEGLELKYELPANIDSPSMPPPAAVRGNHPIPPVGEFSFEIEILDEGNSGEIGIGFGHKLNPLNRMPGWDSTSWGYHGDDGKKYHGSGSGWSYGKTFGEGERVACHIDQSKGTAYFTIDGEQQSGQDIAFANITGRLYPIVGIRSPNARVKARFIWERPDTPPAMEQDLEENFKTEDAGEVIHGKDTTPGPLNTASVLEITATAVRSIQHLWTTLEDIQKVPESVEAIKSELRSVERILLDLREELQEENSKIVEGFRIGNFVKNCDLACQAFEKRLVRWTNYSTGEKIFRSDHWMTGTRRLESFIDQLSSCTNTLAFTLSTAYTLRLVGERYMPERKKFRMLQGEVESIGLEILDTIAEMTRKRKDLPHVSNNDIMSEGKQEELDDIGQQLALYEARQIALEDLLRKTADEQAGTKVKNIKATADNVIVTIDFKGEEKELKIGESGIEETADDRDWARTLIRRQTTGSEGSGEGV